MAIDLNTVEPGGAIGQPIPDKTKAMVMMTLRPGGAGEGGLLKSSEKSTCLMLDAEFTIMAGPFAKRKFWTMFVVDGASTEGQKQAVSISYQHVRAMVEAAYGIKPDDATDAAQAKRRISGWADLNGLVFPVSTKTEKGGLKEDGSRFDDKTVLGYVITPENPDYLSPGAQQLIPLAGPAGGSVTSFANPGQASTGGAVQKPAWAA